jgi:hypothetical protein
MPPQLSAAPDNSVREPASDEIDVADSAAHMLASIVQDSIQTWQCRDKKHLQLLNAAAEVMWDVCCVHNNAIMLTHLLFPIRFIQFGRVCKVGSEEALHPGQRAAPS